MQYRMRVIDDDVHVVTAVDALKELVIQNYTDIGGPMVSIGFALEEPANLRVLPVHHGHSCRPTNTSRHYTLGNGMVNLHRMLTCDISVISVGVVQDM